MTKTYQNYKIHVDLVDFQRFVDRYFQCYREYQQKTQGHARVLVAYEDLCQDPARAMAPVWNLLGVSCPDGNNPLSLKECVPQSAGPLAPLRSSIVNYDELEFACRHDPSLNSFRDLPMDSPLLVEDNSWDKIQRPSSASGDESEVRPSTEADSSHHRWALLIPIRASPADTFDTCRERVKRMYDAIVDTEVSHENFPVLIFGVDDDDPIYTDGKLLQEVCSDNEVVVQVYAGLQGRICRIWKRLATIAYDDYEVDFTLLLGDDVVLLDKGWRLSIEKQFASIARNRKLPFGAACVALYDESFPGFPTFPVVHRWHYETFDRVLLPSTFDNQGGDPFLFELYKRFGASQFALDCKLRNTIGGKHQARYTKQRLRFEDDILTTSLNTLRMALPDHTIMVCIDVVVPCYRCDMAILEKILALRASWPVQVNFWIVLDNPDHEESDKVRALQSIRQNYQVFILEQFDAKGSPRNYGASAARNFGLGHSKADYCVLIDDDCIPSGQLLDAYVGAILRNPKASVFVGLTHFPAPHNLLTHAIVASDIPGAYSIAERTREPPWGVTANLCVKARQSRIRFDLSFPRTGGGEDLDYCARARHHGSIMSVPGAVAHHPWWSNGEFKAVWHIFAWAEGEVQCVGKKHMRDHIFWTFPNGVETLVVGMLTTLMLRYEFGGTVQVLSVKFALWFITVCLCEIAWQASRIGSHRLRDPVKESVMKGVLVRCFAALLIMSQDFFRLLQALDHSPFWLFWRVDWHFGQMPHLISARKRNNAFRFGFYLSLLLFLNFSNLNRSYENA